MNWLIIALGLGAIALYEIAGKKDDSPKSADKDKLTDPGVIDLSSIPSPTVSPDILPIPIPGITTTKSSNWSATAIECEYVSGPGNKVYKAFLVREGENRGAGLVERLGPGLCRLISVIEIDGAYATKAPIVGTKLDFAVPEGIKDCA